MRSFQSSLLDLKDLSSSQAESFFSYVSRMKTMNARPLFSGKTLALFFLEPSTRTRLSFETAAHRCGLQNLVISGTKTTSLEKGETIEDSLLNIAAMDPVAIVVRCGDSVALKTLIPNVQKPVFNAGWGTVGHPTQALLDYFTLWEKKKSVAGLKLLFVGDVAHSRVAASHFEIAPKLAVELGVCCPEPFFPKRSDYKRFESLQDAVAWADVVYVLRTQFERHDSENKSVPDTRYRVGIEHLSDSKKIIMHPGPVNHGIEMTTEAYHSPQSLILDQVKNGVFVREGLLRLVLEGGL